MAERVKRADGRASVRLPPLWTGPQDAAGQSVAAGMRQFIVGTGGRSLSSLSTADSNSEAHNTTACGVLTLTLHAAGYSWQFVPVAGATYSDSGTAACH